MKHQTIRDVLLGAGLLLSLIASAQKFDSELHLSSEKDVYWYRIVNALPGMEEFAVTDFSEEDELCPAQLFKTEESDQKSQWKLTARADGKIVITNRATGQELDGTSVNMGNYNATLIMPEATSFGFTITSLGDNAFKIESVEDDDVNRCLAVVDMDALPISYPEENLSTSVIGWKFLPVEIDSQTGIGTAQSTKSVIRVTNKRISVSGAKWQLFNAQGVEMPRTTRLATGVYMVKIGEKTVKIFVN